jgi:predicted aspartyl protease
VRRVLPVLGILFAVSGPAGTASLEPHRDSLAFRSSRPGEIVVPVTVNGTGPFPFLLDTGSSHTAVSSSLARQLGAAPVAKTVVTSPVGEDVRGVVRLDQVMLGPVTAKGVMA